MCDYFINKKEYKNVIFYGKIKNLSIIDRYCSYFIEPCLFNSGFPKKFEIPIYFNHKIYTSTYGIIELNSYRGEIDDINKLLQP